MIVKIIVRNILECIRKHSFSYECKWMRMLSEHSYPFFYTCYLNFLTLKYLPYNKQWIQKFRIYHTLKVFTILEWLEHSRMWMHLWYVWFILCWNPCFGLLVRAYVKAYSNDWNILECECTYGMYGSYYAEN